MSATSIHRRVLLWALGTLALGACLLVGGLWWYLQHEVGEVFLQSAQRAGERDSLAKETASGLILPALLMLSVIAALLTLALRRGLAPLSRAASEVTARNVEALHPIPLADHPPELHLLMSAINDLMARVGNALAVQRHFVADAAHELRTPVAALKLQLQLLEGASDPAQRQAAIAELGAGVARAQHLIEQLLQLSRLAPEAPPLASEPVALASLVRTAVGQFSARADQQQVDLGAVVQDSPEVAGDAQQLTILLNNLIDNALRHTPPRGKVDVSVYLEGRNPCLCVSDSGPGIAPAEHERVFDRFYRSAGISGGGGSGLGLAIVKAVADRHGAAVVLGDTASGGLRVTVSFRAP